MKIEKSTTSDIPHLSKLFAETIFFINKKDYNENQLKQWANSSIDNNKWIERFEKFDYYKLIINDTIVGFISIDKTGFINSLFVSKDHQRIGIAQMLLNHITDLSIHLKISTLKADVSITARPFFEKNGFKIIKEQQVNLNGAVLTNYAMSKSIEASTA